MYAVIHTDSGKEISYHNTVQEAINMIAIYENADGVKRNLVPGAYDWKPMDE